MNATKPCEETEPAMPAWLIAAEQEEAEERERKLRASSVENENNARLVNEHLAELGIEPIEPARVDRYGSLVPALLVPEDPAPMLYAVFAGYDSSAGPIVLTGYVDEYRESGRVPRQGVRPLRRVADVLAARREGPADVPPPNGDWYGVAARSVLTDSQTESVDAHAIVKAVQGLTAAVLGVVIDHRHSPAATQEVPLVLLEMVAGSKGLSDDLTLAGRDLLAARATDSAREATHRLIGGLLPTDTTEEEANRIADAVSASLVQWIRQYSQANDYVASLRDHFGQRTAAAERKLEHIQNGAATWELPEEAAKQLRLILASADGHVS
ncbi:hypothetical protein ABZ864_40335 [Streptomyces sp. NPDC047082]|uniref:hypothetical protein n=1 Tax=Streptomyces sp. NPDC047082 TaxID=3155259 RepID=UPI0033F102CE